MDIDNAKMLLAGFAIIQAICTIYLAVVIWVLKEKIDHVFDIVKQKTDVR